MIFKKAMVVIGVFAMVVAFQNCNFETESSSVEGKGRNATVIDHFSVDINAHPYAIPGYQYTTKIEAELQTATGTNGQHVILDGHFLVTKTQVKAGQSGSCKTIYNITRDDIRSLLKDMENAKVIKALSPASAVIMDKAIYTLSINYGEKILLSNMNYQKGQLYTEDLGLKDFESALNEHSDKVISSHCNNTVDDNGNSIDAFAVSIVTHPYAMGGYKYTTAIKAVTDKAVSTDGKEFQMKDRFILTKEMTSASGGGSCHITYVVTREEIRSLLAQLELAKIVKASANSTAVVMDKAMYAIKINNGESVLMDTYNYKKDELYTADIKLKDFESTLERLSKNITADHCN